MCDYLFERIKRETRAKAIRQCGYLIVRGIVTKKTNGDALFEKLDELFEIPKKEEKPQMTEEELIDDFESYIKGV